MLFSYDGIQNCNEKNDKLKITKLTLCKSRRHQPRSVGGHRQQRHGLAGTRHCIRGAFHLGRVRVAKPIRQEIEIAIQILYGCAVLCGGQF